jgi:CheY-like chemotaxis protein
MASILVIDDDDGMRTLAAHLLRTRGHVVSEAPNGLAGMALVRQAPPEVVVTDLIMPEQEGIETILQLRKEFPDIRILAMSGGGRRDADEYLRFAAALGALVTLEKPFRVDEFYAAVDQVLAS